MQFTQQVVIHTAGGDNVEDDEKESLEDLKDESFDADVEDEKLIKTKTPIILMMCMVNVSSF